MSCFRYHTPRQSRPRVPVHHHHVPVMHHHFIHHHHHHRHFPPPPLHFNPQPAPVSYQDNRRSPSTPVSPAKSCGFAEVLKGLILHIPLKNRLLTLRAIYINVCMHKDNKYHVVAQILNVCSFRRAGHVIRNIWFLDLLSFIPS